MLAKLINKISQYKKASEPGPVEKFNNIMDFARSVIEKYDGILKFHESTKITEFDPSKAALYPHPLIDVIRILGRTLQIKYLAHLLYDNNHESRWPNISPDLLFFEQKELLSIKNEYISFYDIKTPVQIQKEIYLCKDLILPWPWHRERLINSIVGIGEGRLLGSWEQDDSNHYVELWLPSGIAWVHNGNHSTAVGIIQGEGRIIPESVYDVSKAYDFVYCDGKNYLRTEDNSIISPVKNIEFAAIFEIGRLMRDKSISY